MKAGRMERFTSDMKTQYHLHQLPVDGGGIKTYVQNPVKDRTDQKQIYNKIRQNNDKTNTT